MPQLIVLTKLSGASESWKLNTFSNDFSHGAQVVSHC